MGSLIATRVSLLEFSTFEWGFFCVLGCSVGFWLLGFVGCFGWLCFLRQKDSSFVCHRLSPDLYTAMIWKHTSEHSML